MENLQQKLRLLVQISGKTQEVLAKELKVSFPTFNAWITGKSTPRSAALTRINALLRSYDIPSDSTVESLKRTAVLSLAKKTPNPLKKILDRTDLIDELSLHITYNSNAIEGSTMTVQDTAAVIFDNRTLANKTLTEQLEAKNHDNAFRFLLTYLDKAKVKAIAIDEYLCKKLHYILFAGIRDDAGIYRSHPVRIVGSYVPTANYVRVPELMKELFGRHHTKNPLSSIAAFHADFEKIHPFGDGNGRVGRLLMIAMLLVHRFPPALITKKRRPAYYEALAQAQLQDNYLPLEDVVLDAVIGGYTLIGD